MTSPQNVKKAAEPADIKNELEWIRFREDILGPAAYGESSSSKFYRKMTENPFVPVGKSSLHLLNLRKHAFRISVPVPVSQTNF